MLRAVASKSVKQFGASRGLVARLYATNPFNNLKKKVNVGGKELDYYSLKDLKDSRLGNSKKLAKKI
jgi:hypothetical protein